VKPKENIIGYLDNMQFCYVSVSVRDKYKEIDHLVIVVSFDLDHIDSIIKRIESKVLHNMIIQV
jgi:hypothetical protein